MPTQWDPFSTPALQGANWGSPDYAPSLGAIINQIVPSLVQNYLPPEMTLGEFFPTQNIQDTAEARRFQNLQFGVGQQVGRTGAANDVNDILRGLGSSGLINYDPGQAQTIQNLLGRALPMLSNFMPGIADALGPGVGQMGHAQQLANVFRPMMAMPGMPMSGMGTDATQSRIAELTQGAYQQLYQGDPSYRATRGFGMGRMGEFTNAASQMGLGPNLANITPGGYAQYQQQLAGPMSAMRDLFGPGLSGQQSLAGANALTMGGASQYGFGELEDKIRQFKQLTRAANVSPGIGMGLESTAGNRSVQLGGEAIYGGTAGHHALAYGAELGKMGGNALVGAKTSKAELMQLDAILTVQGMNSETAGQMSALMRLGDEGRLKKGSPGYKAYEALQRGEGMAMTEQEWLRMVERSGVDRRTAQIIRNQRPGNVQKYGEAVAGAVREAQWDMDIGINLSRDIANTLRGPNAMKFGNIAAEVIRANAGASSEEMQDAITEAFDKSGMSGKDASLSASLAYNAAAGTAHRMNYGTVEKMALLHSRELLGGTAKQLAGAAERGEEEKARSHLGQASPPRRVVDAVKAGKPDFVSFLGKVMNVIADDVLAASGAARIATTDMPEGTAGETDGPDQSTQAEAPSFSDDTDAAGVPSGAAAGLPMDSGGW